MGVGADAYRGLFVMAWVGIVVMTLAAIAVGCGAIYLLARGVMAIFGWGS